MATKKAKLIEFQVGIVYSVWTDVTIKAETFEQAYEKAKLLKGHEIHNLVLDGTCNDSAWDIMQVYTPGILEKHGF